MYGSSLTKEMICSECNYYDRPESNYRFLLLQCGATFWLILIIVTETNNNRHITKYTFELLDTWKNYDKTNELLKIDIVKFNECYKIYNYKIRDYDIKLIRNNIKDFERAINNNDFRVDTTFNKYTKITDYKGRFKRENISIPLLKASGLSGCN